MNAPAAPENYWTLNPAQLLSVLHGTDAGLQPADADQRLKLYGPNAIKETQQVTAAGLFLNQFRSPLVLILIFAAVVSMAVGEWVDASIVLAVVLGSTVLGFVQEYSASNAVEKLRSQVTIKSNVLRGGQEQLIPSEQVVPGDVVLLCAGSLIPADGVVLAANDFFVNQAVLTGETFPVEKQPGTIAANASLAERTNCVFMGTSVSSGTARALIVETGRETVFGEIAQRLSLRPPETEFEHGIHRFGDMLTQVMLVMVVIVLAANLFLGKPLMDSILFALALAVGSDARTSARHHQHHALPRRAANGQARRDRAPPELDRELRQHGRALHRQDRHADPGRRPAGRRVRCAGKTLAGRAALRLPQCPLPDRAEQPAG